jgi:hypothetical protein
MPKFHTLLNAEVNGTYLPPEEFIPQLIEETGFQFAGYEFTRAVVWRVIGDSGHHLNVFLYKSIEPVLDMLGQDYSA